MSSIFEQLKPAFALIENALEACRSSKDPKAQDELDSALCCATRDAYADFHSLSLVEDQLDPNSKRKLGQLLDQAIDEFNNERVRRAVTDRRQDFLDFCRLMESNGILQHAIDIAENIKDSD